MSRNQSGFTDSKLDGSIQNDETISKLHPSKGELNVNNINAVITISDKSVNNEINSGCSQEINKSSLSSWVIIYFYVSQIFFDWLKL